MTTPNPNNPNNPNNPKPKHALRLLNQLKHVDPANLLYYLLFDLLGIGLSLVFCASAFLNLYRAVFLFSILILAVAFAQSTISVVKPTK